MSQPRRRVSRFFDITRGPDGGERLEVQLRGIALLRLVLTNKGTAFSREERVALGLEGLLPPQVNPLEVQIERAWKEYQRAERPLDKYQFLRSLQERQEILFFALLERHLVEMLPIVYTPTVGEAVLQFNALYQNPRGLTFSPLDVGRAAGIAANYPMEDVRMIVATDSSAILGLGDCGYGGLAIPIGKLALYTVAGGVSPFHTLPVSLDVGTDRKDLLEDPFYLGVPQMRLRGEAYLAFMDQFVEGITARFPDAVLQWEDLAKDTAFSVLERYRHRLPSFNDDIQGTGAMALAGVIQACRLRGESLAEQRIVIYGAGAGGIGVALALQQGLIREGLEPAEAARRIWVLDSQGLLHEGRDMEAYKRTFAQPRAAFAGWGVRGTPSLVETVENARATVLIGLSGQARAFSERIVRAMAEHTDRPVIFPLSNPTSITEAVPEDILRWTDGRALCATGSPFAPVQLGERTVAIGQGNNAFIFPGLGLGAILSRAREVTEAMVLEGALALAEYTAARHGTAGLVYPPIDELREVAIHVAARVIAQARRDCVAREPAPDGPELLAWVRERFWQPRYLPTVPAAT